MYYKSSNKLRQLKSSPNAIDKLWGHFVQYDLEVGGYLTRAESSLGLVMGPSPGPARARPGPVHFSRDRARIFEKGPSSTQARDRFLEKGLENWDFYVVKIQARQGSGLVRDQYSRLGIGPGSIF